MCKKYIDCHIHLEESSIVEYIIWLDKSSSLTHQNCDTGCVEDCLVGFSVAAV